MYWEYLPNPACHPERLRETPQLRIVMSEEYALLIYLVQCRLFVQNELSLVCHLAATPAASPSISLQRTLILLPDQIDQAQKDDP